MRQIVCEECGKAYDFEKEDFCPKCGAFNQPVKTWGTDAQGNFVRVDGLNESTHDKSFAHSEVHKEKRVRKASGMDWNAQKQAKAPRPTPPPPRQTARPKPPQKRKNPIIIFIQLLLWLVALGAVTNFAYMVWSLFF